ncbi:MAG: hypothetical protein AAGJ18_23975 [Bacteroidota bacterium]
MEAIILKCAPNARFHFGITAPDNDTALSDSSPFFHSDTLFSALVITCSKVFPRKVSVLIDYFKNGELRISSGNYCVDITEKKQWQKRLYFLPRPSHFRLRGKHHADRKQINKVQYISKTIWELGIPPEVWFEDGGSCYQIENKQFLLHESDLPREKGKLVKSFFEEQTAPKIADHARKKEGNIYFQTDIHLRTTKIGTLTLQPHFYFLVDFGEEDENIRNLVHFLIGVLVDEGIGGAISTGCGKIEDVERINDWKLAIVPSDQHEVQKVSNALIAFGEKEAFSKVHLGEIITRGGRTVYVDQDKAEDKAIKCQRVKMVREGALITNAIQGTIPTLFDEPPFHILRYGKAFPLAIPKNYGI